MIELQEDEVDDHDTSTIDEVSFPANLSFASYLKMAKNTATSQTNKLKKLKKHGKPDKKNKLQKNIANQPKKKLQKHGKQYKYMGNQAEQTNYRKQGKPNQLNKNTAKTWQTKPNKQSWQKN